MSTYSPHQNLATWHPQTWVQCTFGFVCVFLTTYFIINCVYVCVSVCGFDHMITGAHRGWKRVVWFPGARVTGGFWTAVYGVGTELGSSAPAASTHNSWANAKNLIISSPLPDSSLVPLPYPIINFSYLLIHTHICPHIPVELLLVAQKNLMVKAWRHHSLLSMDLEKLEQYCPGRPLLAG